MIVDLQEKSKELVDAPMETRLQHFAHRLLGVKYGCWKNGTSLESLDDFNYNFELLDCVTYVELVLALAKTRPGNDFIELLKKIHYKDGVPNYISSNYFFFSIDWIPNNTNIFQDVTANVAIDLRVASTLIDKQSWLQKTRDITTVPDHLQDMMRPREVKTNYIPTTDLLDNQIRYFDNFPEYSLACIVRPNWDLTEKMGTHIDISHVGFVFKDYVTQTLRFYHASGSIFGDPGLPYKVVTLDFCEYMTKYISHPTVTGINVLAIHPGYFDAG